MVEVTEFISGDGQVAKSSIFRAMNALLHRLRSGLWDFESSGRYPQLLVHAARYAFVLARDLMEGQLNMRAMSLVYTSLLSLVPLLALAFSVLKGLGAHDMMQPVLMEFLRPLGPQAQEVSDRVLDFIANMQVKVLGAVGVALLFYTAISMIRKIEESFNFIWRIERPRRMSQRMSEYLAVLTVGPVLVIAALSLTGSVLNSAFVLKIAAIEPFGMLIFTVTSVLPYLLIIGAFTFLYMFVPNTRVGFRAALYGGLLAGVLWQSGSLAFGSFIARSNYGAVYSGFAIVIFLLIWLYLSWLILLVGCQLAFYIQHPEHLKPQRVPPLLSGKEMEYLALMIMGLAGRRFIDGGHGYTHEELALELRAQPEHVSRVVQTLIFHRLLTEAGGERTRLIPAMDLETITLSRLWRLVRAGHEPMPMGKDGLAHDATRLIDDAEAAFEQHTGGLTLRAWLTREPRDS
jgi:membrane protein